MTPRASEVRHARGRRHRARGERFRRAWELDPRAWDRVQRTHAESPTHVGVIPRAYD
jgi:hypothetical protein